MHEHVRATLDRDEAVALIAVEPLHSALRRCLGVLEVNRTFDTIEGAVAVGR
jgi:hypothetical protein